LPQKIRVAKLRGAFFENIALKTGLLVRVFHGGPSTGSGLTVCNAMINFCETPILKLSLVKNITPPPTHKKLPAAGIYLPVPLILTLI